MIGFRVLDVGLLVVWLVWFFRLRDDDDSDGGGGGPGGEGPEPGPTGDPGGGGLVLPLGSSAQAPAACAITCIPAAASGGAAPSPYRLLRPRVSGDRRLRRRSIGVRVRRAHRPQTTETQTGPSRFCGLWTVDCATNRRPGSACRTRSWAPGPRRSRLRGGGLGRRARAPGPRLRRPRRPRWWWAAGRPVCRRWARGPAERRGVNGTGGAGAARRAAVDDRRSLLAARNGQRRRGRERLSLIVAAATATAACRQGQSDHPEYQREGPSHGVVSARRRAGGGRSAGSR